MNYRVAYTNALDGKRRVLVGNVDMATAVAVKARFGNKKDRSFYMGTLFIEPCDGMKDGCIIQNAGVNGGAKNG